MERAQAKLALAEHGMDFLIVFSNGSTGGSFSMKFDSYEFNSPYGQAYQEAGNICNTSDQDIQDLLVLKKAENNYYINI